MNNLLRRAENRTCDCEDGLETLDYAGICSFQADSDIVSLCISTLFVMYMHTDQLQAGIGVRTAQVSELVNVTDFAFFRYCCLLSL
jgi:hypothetical protein